MQSFKKIWNSLLIVVVFLATNYSKAQEQDPIPQHDSFTIDSKILNEKRVINVWNPLEYSQNSLPVLYMADGGVKEDFPHIANTLAKLIKAKKIKPIILVGIENTERRRDLTGETQVAKDKKVAPVVGGSTKFRAFISDELIPEINKKYRTTKEKGIIGESLSGLFVMETLMEKPELFDFYIAFDPSLWWNNQYLVKNAQKDLAKIPQNQQKKLWFAGSGTKDISPMAMRLAKILETENKPNIIWKYSDEPKEKHNTIFRATKEKALIWTLNNLK